MIITKEFNPKRKHFCPICVKPMELLKKTKKEEFETSDDTNFWDYTYIHYVLKCVICKGRFIFNEIIRNE